MANFEVDYQFMIANEDRTQAHACVPDSCPLGCAGPCYAISGVNSGAFPKQFAIIAALPQAQRGPAVEQFYQEEFFNKYEAQLSDQVAERVLDTMVNNGPMTGVRLLQEAVNTLGGALAVDGAWGAKTVAASNACDQGELVTAFQARRAALYRAIVTAHPEDAAYEAGWLARAAK